MKIFIFIHRAFGELRRNWIPSIKTHQSLNDQKAVYICDLHFHESDLNRCGRHVQLKKNAKPLLGDFNNEGNLRAPNAPNVEAPGCSSHDDTARKTVTISDKAYQRLVETSIRVIKLNKTIKRLSDLISRKDATITELKKKNLNRKSDMANLSPVSFIFENVVI